MAAAPDDDARRTLAELEAKLRELERELLRGRDPEPRETAAPDPLAAEPPPPEARAAEPPPDPHAAEPPPPEALAAEPFPAAEPPRPDPLAAEPFPAAEPAPADPLAAEADDSLGDHVAFPPAPLDDGTPPPPELDLDALAAAQELLIALRTTLDELETTAGRITVEARAVVADHGRALARLDLAARAAAKAEAAAAEAGRVAGTVVIEAGPFAEPAPLLALRDALAAQPGTKDAYVRGVEDGRAVIEVHLAPPTA
jgi:hypothetical protein